MLTALLIAWTCTMAPPVWPHQDQLPDEQTFMDAAHTVTADGRLIHFGRLDGFDIHYPDNQTWKGLQGLLATSLPGSAFPGLTPRSGSGGGHTLMRWRDGESSVIRHYRGNAGRVTTSITTLSAR